MSEIRTASPLRFWKGWNPERLPPDGRDVVTSSLYSTRQRWGYLIILFLVSTSQFFDRNVISVLLEPIKKEFGVSDAMLGLLGGLCFALFYAAGGIPLARWADRGNRRTIISLSLSIWSAMTILCGFAHTFWQLALARIGVGVGESGGIPPAQSLIADYFPREQRATALAFFTGGSSAGTLLGFVGGGYIAAAYGWRSALIWGGVAGLFLACLARVVLAEPRLAIGFRQRKSKPESVLTTFQILWGKRSFRYVLYGLMSYFLFAYGALIFIPSFLMRVLNATLIEASVGYGTVGAVGSLAGTVAGGVIVDRLSKRDVRWLGWWPSLVCTLTFPIYVVAFASRHIPSFLVLNCVGFMAIAAATPAVYTAVHAICGDSRRATAIAIFYFSTSLFGAGLGPLVAGMLSDVLSLQLGSEGLRYSLIVMTSSLLVSGGLFYLSSREISRDLEE